MIDLNVVRDFVCKAHAGQYYGNADYYNGHLLPVAVLVDKEAEAQEYDASSRFVFMAVALLHDSIGETRVNYKDIHDALEKAGYTATEIDMCLAALICLTKTEQESYDDYIEHLLGSTIARLVKKCDATFNMTQCISDGDYKRAKKYLKVVCRINEYENQIGV